MENEEKSNAVYGDGTVFIITNHYDGMTEREAFILADCFEEGKVLQIVQITGHHAGWMAGYVNEGISQSLSVTYEELVEAIKFNFIGPDFSTLQILDDRLELKDLSID